MPSSTALSAITFPIHVNMLKTFCVQYSLNIRSGTLFMVYVYLTVNTLLCYGIATAIAALFHKGEATDWVASRRF